LNPIPSLNAQLLPEIRRSTITARPPARTPVLHISISSPVQGVPAQQRQRVTALPEIHEEEELPASNSFSKRHQIFESWVIE
jgi:hypothetical protein